MLDGANSVHKHRGHPLGHDAAGDTTASSRQRQVMLARLHRGQGFIRPALFDDLIRPQEQRLRDRETEGLGGLEVDHRSKQILTPPEIRRLLEAADEPVRTVLMCAALTGMRHGELFGLRWEDIDLESNRIFVRRALWRGKFVTPKSRRSRRAIDMAPTLRAALSRLSSRFHGGLVFCSSNGKPIDPDNFVHRVWRLVLRRAELRRVRFHDLRHTYASLLIAQGAHPKYIQAQLGHASIQTTLDRYGHLMPDAHAAEARKLDRLVFGESGRRASDVVGDAVQRVQNGCRNVEGVSGVDR